MALEKAEQVLTAARKVFLKYGYRRVTMGDIAEAAHMSRPALYLVFASKEQIFKELMSRMIAENLSEIRSALPKLKLTEEKLTLIFEVWAVRPYELVHSNPDASDLLESGCEFAFDVITAAAAEFQSILADVLEPAVSIQNALPLNAAQIAAVLANSMHGIKKAAKSSTELRQMLQDLLTITMTSLRVKKRN